MRSSREHGPDRIEQLRDCATSSLNTSGPHVRIKRCSAVLCWNRQGALVALSNIENK
jgi:hypothetical protein